MASRRTRRISRSFLAAITLSSILATQAIAATWQWIPVAVQIEDVGGTIGTPGGLVTLAPTTAVAIYEDHAGIYIRRSTDSGATWATPLQLSTFEDSWEDPRLGRMGIAGLGSMVDAVWIEGWQVRADAHIRYVSSSDGGATFGTSVAIASPARGFPVDVAVARGSDDTVAVAWSKKYGSRYSVRVKVSLDGGATFGTATLLAKGGDLRDAKVAVGDGVIYVAYVVRRDDGNHRLRIVRSLDGGTTWSSPLTLSKRLAVADYSWRRFPGTPSIAAIGRRVIVGFTARVNGVERALYRRSSDRGATWSNRVSLSSRRSGYPVISLERGAVRAVYMRCFNRECATSGIRYREKAPGTGWTSPEVIIGRSDVSPWPAGVGYVGRPIVLWMLPPDGSGGDFGTYASVMDP